MSARKALIWGLALVCASPASAQEAASFYDSFDTLDAARWYVADGWANGDYQNCAWSSKEVRVADGILSVGFSKTPAANRDYTCGEIATRTSVGYGVIEARIRTPEGPGLDAAFFTYIGPVHKQPHDEIDFEFLLKDTSKVQTTTFVSGKSGDGETGNGEVLDLPYPSSTDFLDVAIVWEPGKLSWYINKELARELTVASEVPTHPQRIYFNLWGTDTLSDWLGVFEEPPGPIAMEVDWVAYTAPGDTCQFPESLVCTLGN